MLQYLCQAWGSRGPVKYRDRLLNTGTEEIGHVETLSTAVALNPEGAPLSFKEGISKDGVAGGRRAERHEPAPPLQHAFLMHDRSGKAPPEGRWTQGRSLDGKGESKATIYEPIGGEPRLAPARPDGGARAERSSKSGLAGAVEGAVEQRIL